MWSQISPLALAVAAEDHPDDRSGEHGLLKAFSDALAAGQPTSDAALAARSAGLNAIYQLEPKRSRTEV